MAERREPGRQEDRGSQSEISTVIFSAAVCFLVRHALGRIVSKGPHTTKRTMKRKWPNCRRAEPSWLCPVWICAPKRTVVGAIIFRYFFDVMQVVWYKRRRTPEINL